MEDQDMRLLRTKLAARALMRMTGGYGHVGGLKAMAKVAVIGTAVLFALQMVR